MSALQQGKVNAVLNLKMKFEEGIMTRREWLVLKKGQGAEVGIIDRRNYVAEEKLETWIYNHREDNSGNPNWPATKFWLAEKERLKAGIYKREYTLRIGKSIFDITKTEYDYFNSLGVVNTQTEPQEVCNTCGGEMDSMSHNYGTEDILTCIHCYNDAQQGN